MEKTTFLCTPCFLLKWNTLCEEWQSSSWAHNACDLNVSPASMIPCRDSLFTFPSCKRSCTAPSVCHADANKPLQVAMATRLIRNGLMLGLIRSNFPSPGCNEMVKELKDLELPALGKIWKRRVSCCSFQNWTWIFEHLLAWTVAGLENCTRVPEESSPAWSWFHLSRARAQPTALGCPASASFERSTNHSGIKTSLCSCYPFS